MKICGAFKTDISADPEFGDLYKEWDAAPYTEYLGLSLVELKDINLHSVCPWQKTDIGIPVFKQDIAPHSTNAVLDDITTVVQLVSTVLVAFLVYVAVKCVRKHVAEFREREVEARSVAARATQRALTAEGAAAVATAQRDAAVTERDAALTVTLALEQTEPESDEVTRPVIGPSGVQTLHVKNLQLCIGALPQTLTALHVEGGDCSINIPDSCRTVSFKHTAAPGALAPELPHV
jgi:hypothetical protein